MDSKMMMNCIHKYKKRIYNLPTLGLNIVLHAMAGSTWASSCCSICSTLLHNCYPCASLLSFECFTFFENSCCMSYSIRPLSLWNIHFALLPLLFFFSMHLRNSVMSNPHMVFNIESKNLSNLCIEHKGLDLEI